MALGAYPCRRRKRNKILIAPYVIALAVALQEEETGGREIRQSTCQIFSPALLDDDDDVPSLLDL